MYVAFVPDIAPMGHWKSERRGQAGMTEISQYSGHILRVDLTTRQTAKDPIDMKTVTDFIGGSGINNKLGYELIKPGVAPLSPENVIIFGGCALGGTLAPSSSRIMATTKFPTFGTIGTASGGSCGE